MRLGFTRASDSFPNDGPEDNLRLGGGLGLCELKTDCLYQRDSEDTLGTGVCHSSEDVAWDASVPLQSASFKP